MANKKLLTGLIREPLQSVGWLGTQGYQTIIRRNEKPSTTKPKRASRTSQSEKQHSR